MARFVTGPERCSSRQISNPQQNMRDTFFTPFESVLEDFFQDFIKDASFSDKVKANAGYPKLNIFNDGVDFIIQVAVPGIAVEDLKVEMRPSTTKDANYYRHTGGKDYDVANILKISGSSPSLGLNASQFFYVKELSSRSFAREITLPDWIQSDPKTKLSNGILQLSWPMPTPKEPKTGEVTPRLIPIESE